MCILKKIIKWLANKNKIKSKFDDIFMAIIGKTLAKIKKIRENKNINTKNIKKKIKLLI